MANADRAWANAYVPMTLRITVLEKKYELLQDRLKDLINTFDQADKCIEAKQCTLDASWDVTMRRAIETARAVQEAL